MKKTNLIIIAVIGGLILLGLGFSLGLSLGKKAMEEVKTEAPLADLLESKVIGSFDIVASGEVTEISGRSLTLGAEGDTLTISIKEDTPIYREVPSKEIEGVPTPIRKEEIEFGEIKIGDRISISCELKADVSLEGIEVTILP